MLPLWIIDITKPSDRQTNFRRLLGQVDGLLTQDNLSDFFSSKGMSEGKNQKQWLYTHYDNVFKDIDPEEESEVTAQLLYEFQEQLVADGQGFVRMLRYANVNASMTLNICVLGDATESFTNLIFPSIAVLIQKEKGRIVPNHIHQGMSIIGSLYIPSNVNSLQVGIRQQILLTLREIEVQHNISSVRGYDKMFIYQDVQNRTERFHPILDEEGQAEYLMQCLIHLFYACDDVHPLISGSSSDDSFYFSLGVASCFFDTSVQDRLDTLGVVNGLIDTLGKEGDLEEADNLSEFIDYEKIDVKRLTEKFQNVEFDISKVRMTDPYPHPVNHFLHSKLKNLYYGNYLRYYPANLRLKILNVISRESESVLEEISAERRKTEKIFTEMSMPAALEKQITSSNKHTGVISRISKNLKALKTQLGKMKGQLTDRIEQNIWQHLIQHNVPKKLRQDFENYHEIYKLELSKKGSTNACDTMKEAAQLDLVNILKQEPTFLGILGRSFLMGIVLVLSLMPLLSYLSPYVIDLGDVHENAAYWAAGIFLLPLLWNFVTMFLYLRKRGMKERKLKAYYLHDAYARIANRIQSEAGYLYDHLMNLCDEYVNRCKQVQTDLHPTVIGDIYSQIEIPVTRFNQPIMEGSFNGNILIPGGEDESRKIYVNRVPLPINELDENNRHQMLHSYKDEVMSLFYGIKVDEKHERRFDENLGYAVFVSNEERREDKRRMWEISLEKFRTSIKSCVEKDFIPRQHVNVGEMLMHFTRKSNNNELLYPMLRYAATNGELTSSSDTETIDVKSNTHLTKPLFENFFYENSTHYQFDPHEPLLEKFLFVTRWRTFNNVALNRILPSEDFDLAIRGNLVNENEQDFLINKPSSLILWSMCRNDSSREWLRLFDGTELSKWLEERKVYSDKLTTKD